jgi:hypothetical protein
MMTTENLFSTAWQASQFSPLAASCAWRLPVFDLLAV